MEDGLMADCVYRLRSRCYEEFTVSDVEIMLKLRLLVARFRTQIALAWRRAWLQSLG